MAELSEKDLLLLDNFMYISGSTKSDKSIGNIAKKLLGEGLEEKNISGGITVEEAENILREIQSNESLKNLTITSSIDNDGVRGSCFVDSEGNATVAFRGTGGSYQAWEDNLLGEYDTDTKYQQQAADFIRDNCSAYDSITVTGHSKGGNLAQYCTVICGDQIDRCISYDGQGFNQDFLRKYAEEIAANQGKITSICADGDYVNLLLTSLAGKTSYLETIDLPGELGGNPELTQTLNTLLAEVRREKDSMKQMKEVLDASIQCYQKTERKLVSQAG